MATELLGNTAMCSVRNCKDGGTSEYSAFGVSVRLCPHTIACADVR